MVQVLIEKLFPNLVGCVLGRLSKLHESLEVFGAHVLDRLLVDLELVVLLDRNYVAVLIGEPALSIHYDFALRLLRLALKLGRWGPDR